LLLKVSATIILVILLAPLSLPQLQERVLCATQTEKSLLVLQELLVHSTAQTTFKISVKQRDSVLTNVQAMGYARMAFVTASLDLRELTVPLLVE